MADNHSVGMFLIGIAFGMFIHYVTLPSQLEALNQYLPLVPVVLLIVAVIVFVKG
ncbi:MAG: hypothetical protein JW772_00445 [Candidatus Diapherotrites archaeon]|nr:hypothetical protein [Candidatus Diapherotrites archaeon]